MDTVGGVGDSGMRALLCPTTVAILGCSGDVQRINGRPLKYFLENGFRGKLFPVNPKYDEIAGLQCYSSIAAISERIDLAVVAVPAHAVLSEIKALVEKGTRAAVVFSSGFAEMGAEGAALQDELVKVARAGRMRLCGPNAVGVLNAFDGVTATFSEYLERRALPGPVGFVSQSGAFGTAIASLARDRQIGLGYFVNTGNECDVDFAEALEFLVSDDRIKVVAGYLEGIKDGRRLLEVADYALRCGKPLVLTKVGRSDAGARAAASHTGALAGSDILFDDVFRQHGVIRAHDEEELLDFIDLFCRATPPRGENVGIVTQSGGAGVLACDRGEEVGLSFPPLGDTTRARLRECLPGYAALRNPVDATGLSLAEPEIMRAAMKIVLEDPAIDVGVLWVRLMSGYVDVMAEILEDVRATTRKTFVVCWVSAPSAAVERLRNAGFCIARGATQAMNALGALVRYEKMKSACNARCSVRAEGGDIEKWGGEDGGSWDAGSAVPTLAAAEALRSAGVPLIPTELARSAGEAVGIAKRLGFPVALKIEAAGIVHKSDLGGVRLNLGTAQEVMTAFSEVMRAAHGASAEGSAGVLVQPMAGQGVELVVGVSLDATFGPVVMVGLGGIFVEIFKDVHFRTAPVTPEQVGDMLSELRGAAVLRGSRGRPSVNMRALCSFVAAVSEMAVDRRGRLRSLDLNPVIASREGVVAVDWFMVAGKGRYTAPDGLDR